VKPALFVRFPRFSSPAVSSLVIPAAARDAYPALRDDLDLLDQEVVPAFTEHDLKALRSQNSYRGQQIVLLIGAALLSGLGGLQAMFPEQRWPGVLIAVLGLLLGAFGRWAKRQRSLDAYLTARLRAERLRAVHFQFLARRGRYAGPEAADELRRSVRSIADGREPT
jgi:hypothetical protein